MQNTLIRSNHKNPQNKKQQQVNPEDLRDFLFA